MSEHGFVIWNSVKGGWNGIVTAHLVNPKTGRTFCGKKKGRMTTRWNSFDKNDCKICGKQLEQK